LGEAYKTLSAEMRHVIAGTMIPVLTEHSGYHCKEGRLNEDAARSFGNGSAGLSFFISDCGDKENSYRMQIPILMLDARIIKNAGLLPDQPIIKNLVELSDVTNHDHIHQFSHSSLYTRLARGGRSIDKWREYHVHGGMDHSDARSYENWHILAHAKLLEQEGEGINLEDQVEAFISSLESYADELIQENIETKKTHEIIDYLGTVGAASIMKVMGLGDPRLTKYLERLKKIDPTPEEVLSDIKSLKLLDLSATATKDETLKAVNNICPDNKNLRSALKNFKKAGEIIKTKEDSNLDYLNIKRFQLACLNPSVANVYSPTRTWGTGTIKKAHEVIERSLEKLPDALGHQTSSSPMKPNVL
jgi:hypothetical protein